MFNSTDFVYNGEKSSDYNLLLVKTGDAGGGLLQYPFLQDNNIVSEQIMGNDTPYVYGMQRNPQKFTCYFALKDGFYWDNETRAKVGALFDNGKFNEFYSMDDPDKRYFVTVVSGVNFFNNANLQGYIQIDFQTLNAYTYSPVYEQFYDFSTITSATTFQFTNNGIVECYPDIEITKYGNGDLNLINLSNGGYTFGFTGLVDQEQLTIDNENRIITSTYGNRSSSFNKNYMYFVYGVNQVQVSSACQIKFTWRCRMKG